MILFTEEMAITNNSWEVYHFSHGDNAEKMAIVSFDLTYLEKENQSGYKECRRIIFHAPADKINDNGLITPEENLILNGYEDLLVERLEKGKIDCKLVGKLSISGVKDFVFQMNDTDQFESIVEDWKKEITDYEVSIKESEGWDFYNEYIRPQQVNMDQITNRRVIDELVQNGSNPDLKHKMEFSFKGDNGKLEKLRKHLKMWGFKEDERFEDDILVKVYEDVLNLYLVTDITTMLHGVCEEFGVEYIGWGAQIVSEE